jgi:hypothetical protein
MEYSKLILFPMNFQKLLLLGLLSSLVICDQQLNDVTGKGNVINGIGGNVVHGDGNVVNAVDPTKLTDEIRKLQSQDTKGKFVIDTPPIIKPLDVKAAQIDLILIPP